MQDAPLSSFLQLTIKSPMELPQHKMKEVTNTAFLHFALVISIHFILLCSYCSMLCCNPKPISFLALYINLFTMSDNLQISHPLAFDALWLMQFILMASTIVKTEMNADEKPSVLSTLHQHSSQYHRNSTFGQVMWLLLCETAQYGLCQQIWTQDYCWTQSGIHQY